MDNKIVGMFESLAAAERARDELIAAGFARDRVDVWVRDDEAGPPQGNFTVGDDPSVTGSEDYQGTYKVRQPQPEHCMVVVDAPDSAMASRAAAILDLAGATNPGGEI
jgi:hypothetical protein